MAKTCYEIKSVRGAVFRIGDKEYPVLEASIGVTHEMEVVPQCGWQGTLRIKQSHKEARHN